MQARLTTTFGEVVIDLHDDKAPVSCENFATYVRDGHYDGTIFHRIIPGFMVQGGGFEVGMKERPTGEPIKNEADNGLSNNTGTVAMARTPDAHSATAQFFVNVADNHFLNFKLPTRDGWGYCVFGTVTKGMEGIMSMTEVPTGRSGGHQDVPRDDILLVRAEMIEA
jgi:peptidyl-prolyl cis-trans isomerase B (cyclophilin B)